MAVNGSGVRVKDVICQEHGGTFEIPVRRGRTPSKCGGNNPVCAGRPKASNARETREASRKGADTPRTRPAAQRRTQGTVATSPAKTRPGKRERVSGLDRIEASVNASTGRGPATAKGVRESRSAKSGWCRCTAMGKEPHNRGVEGCKYHVPDPTTVEKELPEFAAYFPARMKNDEWVILHAAGCDHLNERQLKRTDNVKLDLFASDMSENLSKLDVDGLGFDWNSVGISNCALNLAKRARKANQKAAEKPAALKVSNNPCLPLAQKAKEDLTPLGWEVKGRAWTENESEGTLCAQITAHRGTELLVITWTATKSIDGGEYLITSDQQYNLWNTDKPSENRKPTHTVENGRPKRLPKLPFNPALISDKELIQALAGQRVKWANRLRTTAEEAIVSPERIQIDHTYNGNGDSIPSERIIKFADFGGGGFRAFHLSALLSIG